MKGRADYGRFSGAWLTLARATGRPEEFGKGVHERRRATIDAYWHVLKPLDIRDVLAAADELASTDDTMPSAARWRAAAGEYRRQRTGGDHQADENRVVCSACRGTKWVLNPKTNRVSRCSCPPELAITPEPADPDARARLEAVFADIRARPRAPRTPGQRLDRLGAVSKGLLDLEEARITQEEEQCDPSAPAPTAQPTSPGSTATPDAAPSAEDGTDSTSSP